jgi:hypothetical protein
MANLGDVIEYLLVARPGRTARELAQAVFGSQTQAREIGLACSRLVADGRVAARLSPDGETPVYFAAGAAQRIVATPQRTAQPGAHSLLALFRAARTDLRLAHARLFVEIATQEGLGIEIYARRLGEPAEATRFLCRDLARGVPGAGQRPALVEMGAAEICRLTLDGCRLLGRFWAGINDREMPLGRHATARQ